MSTVAVGSSIEREESTVDTAPRPHALSYATVDDSGHQDGVLVPNMLPAAAGCCPPPACTLPGPLAILPAVLLLHLAALGALLALAHVEDDGPNVGLSCTARPYCWVVPN